MRKAMAARKRSIPGFMGEMPAVPCELLAATSRRCEASMAVTWGCFWQRGGRETPLGRSRLSWTTGAIGDARVLPSSSSGVRWSGPLRIPCTRWGHHSSRLAAIRQWRIHLADAFCGCILRMHLNAIATVTTEQDFRDLAKALAGAFALGG